MNKKNKIISGIPMNDVALKKMFSLIFKFKLNKAVSETTKLIMQKMNVNITNIKFACFDSKPSVA
jgi:hypothetical protein